jgi:hypothetical protein
MGMADEQGGALAKKDGALVGIAVTAAVGAAVYGLQKALAGGGEGLWLHQHRQRGGSLLVAAVESAGDSLLPLAEAAAEEVGRWAAKNSPELIRDRLLPRFIHAFTAAS